MRKVGVVLVYNLCLLTIGSTFLCYCFLNPVNLGFIPSLGVIATIAAVLLDRILNTRQSTLYSSLFKLMPLLGLLLTIFTSGNLSFVIFGFTLSLVPMIDLQAMEGGNSAKVFWGFTPLLILFLILLPQIDDPVFGLIGNLIFIAHYLIWYMVLACCKGRGVIVFSILNALFYFYLLYEQIQQPPYGGNLDSFSPYLFLFVSIINFACMGIYTLIKVHREKYASFYHNIDEYLRWWTR